MVIGYVLHFMPKSAENAVQGVVTRSPFVGAGCYSGGYDFLL